MTVLGRLSRKQESSANSLKIEARSGALSAGEASTSALGGEV